MSCGMTEVERKEMERLYAIWNKADLVFAQLWLLNIPQVRQVMLKHGIMLKPGGDQILRSGEVLKP